MKSAKTANKFAEVQGIFSCREILVFERLELLRAEYFVLCTTSFLGWTAAILGVLRDTLS